MKILIVTNMYPIKEQSFFGIFVKEQREDLKRFCNVDSDLYFINGRRSRWNYIKSVFKLKRVIKKGNYDLIHIHYGLSGLFLLFNPFIRIPKIITLHNGDIDKKAGEGNVWLTKLILRRVDKILILNDHHKQLVKKHVHKAEILKCGVDTNVFKGDFPDFKRSENEINILFPGVITNHRKNFELFSKIIVLLEERIPQKINVFTLGNYSRLQLAELLNRCDLVLMTSISEGSPQIIKEAMACDVPVVSTKVGDIVDLLADVDNCCIVDTFEPNDFIIPIVKILDSSKRSTESRNKLFELGLDNQSISKRLERLYKNTVQLDTVNN